MIAACLSFQPQVVGKSNVYNFRRFAERQQHKDKMYFNNQEEEEHLTLDKTKKRIKMPRYMRIYDEQFKWPILDITSSLKHHHHHHSSVDNCNITRFDHIYPSL